MGFSNLPAPPSDHPRDVADWVEATFVAGNRPFLSRTLVRGWLRDALLLEERAELEELIDAAWLELERRSAIVPDCYPFRVSRRLERDQEVDALPYLFCLALSASEGYRDRGEYQQASVLFEYLMLDALCAYLGPGTEGVRFGWPPRNGRPGGFVEALDWLAERIGLQRGPGLARAESNDGGVDVVVWRSFGDGRPGHLIILGQGTVSKSWPGKEKDVIESVWDGFIDFGKHPVVSFGVPHIVDPRDLFWDQLRRTVHIVLDRLRLCELASLGGLREEATIRAWTEAEFAFLAAE